MNCNIIKDLIPLYIDDCCSKESAEAVKEHMKSCTECRTLYENMKTPAEIVETAYSPVKLERVNDWKASILQSVLLFVSFIIITIGVALEAGTPSGFTNSLWALWLVVPTTGFMLSLANWYFVKFYKSRKSFSNCSCLLTLVLIISAYIFVRVHYEMPLLLFCVDFKDLIGVISFWFGPGYILSAVYCVLSKVLSNKYAKMLGKE